MILHCYSISSGNGIVSSPSDMKIAADDFHDIHDLPDPRGLHDQLC
jgi:hypothetical protein